MQPPQRFSLDDMNVGEAKGRIKLWRLIFYAKNTVAVTMRIVKSKFIVEQSEHYQSISVHLKYSCELWHEKVCSIIKIDALKATVTTHPTQYHDKWWEADFCNVDGEVLTLI